MQIVDIPSPQLTALDHSSMTVALLLIQSQKQLNIKHSKVEIRDCKNTYSVQIRKYANTSLIINFVDNVGESES